MFTFIPKEQGLFLVKESIPYAYHANTREYTSFSSMMLKLKHFSNSYIVNAYSIMNSNYKMSLLKPEVKEALIFAILDFTTAKSCNLKRTGFKKVNVTDTNF